MRILVAIPYHENKRYCLNELFDWIRDADLKDCEIVMRVHKGIYGEKNAVKIQREFFRTLGEYDYIFFVGADTVPPLDALLKLLSRNVDVVGGIYYGRNNSENGNGQTAVAWKHKQPEFNKRKNLEQLQGMVEVDGMGCDCLLLSKKAVKAVSWFEWEQNDDDYPFFDKLKERGFRIWLDTEVVCKHFYEEDKFN